MKNSIKTRPFSSKQRLIIAHRDKVIELGVVNKKIFDEIVYTEDNYGVKKVKVKFDKAFSKDEIGLSIDVIKQLSIPIKNIHYQIKIDKDNII